MPGYHKGRPPANKGKKGTFGPFPPGRRPHTPRKRWEIGNPYPRRSVGPFQQISPVTSIGIRNRALITMLYRAGSRHSEAPALLP